MIPKIRVPSPYAVVFFGTVLLLMAVFNIVPSFRILWFVAGTLLTILGLYLWKKEVPE